MKANFMKEASSTPSRATYGGEVEVLIIDKFTQVATPFSQELRERVQQKLTNVLDRFGLPVLVGYDATKALVELRGVVYDELPDLLYALQHALFQLWKVLEEDGRQCLLASAYHPLDKLQAAYKHIMPRPVYSLVAGSLDGRVHVHPNALAKIYPTAPEKGRNWNHQRTALSTAIQPWNSLNSRHAAGQLAVLQATGWLFNLLTANSPFADGRWTEKRDYRLETWEAITATSRYKQDRALTSNLPAKPERLVDYYKYVFSNQRPAIIPNASANGNPIKDSKTNFLAVKQPDDEHEFNMLTYLQADNIKVIDLETAKEQDVIPDVTHIFNNFDFFYVPRYGARLRINLPHADRLDPKSFAQAIIDSDEDTFQSLLVKGGIEEGYICVEGRVAATVLPRSEKVGWAQFNIPFVLQTAIIRTYQEIFNLFEHTALTWTDLIETLPAMTNDTRYGFKTELKGCHVTDLAHNVWKVAQKSLTSQEYALIGDEIDTLLARQKAPAEEQIALFGKEWDKSTEQDKSTEKVMPGFIHHLCVESLPEPVNERDLALCTNYIFTL
jgi:hypothetical protein